MFTIDFETEKIVDGSPTCPRPVGVSIKHNYTPSLYYSFGHKFDNNSDESIVYNILHFAIHSNEELVFHNAKFDLRIIVEYFGLSMPHPSRINDTMIMAYIVDPREDSLALKTLAQKYCGILPDERDELKEWIVRSIKGATSTNWGEYISEAPGSLAGRYAEADTDMTLALYDYFEPLVNVGYSEDHQTSQDAYDREMKLIPIVISLERKGISLSDRIHAAHTKEASRLSMIDLQLSAYGNGEKPGSKAMFNVLRKKGLIDESKIQYTDKGNPRYGKEFLSDMISDPELVKILSLRAKLVKFVGTYLRPFSESASKYEGKFYPYYNQTRSDNDYGTKTGRFSSNIQQLPKSSGTNFTIYAEEDFTIAEMEPIRSYIIPSSTNKVLVKRDFSGQELRVTAHYAEGSILQAYIDNPRMDVHEFVDNLIQEKTGHHLTRTPVKMINFLKLYGGGPTKLAERLTIPIATAKQFFAAYDESLPEFKQLMKDIEKLARSGKKIRTWGGRSYDVEQAKWMEKGNGGYYQEFYYKLGNVLIQGSSADMTKEAMIRYYYHPERKGEIVLVVHDEIVIEVDKEHMLTEMNILKWAMDDMPGWDVPLCSDGLFGENFGNMKARAYVEIDDSTAVYIEAKEVKDAYKEAQELFPNNKVHYEYNSNWIEVNKYEALELQQTD